jgi:hypothetical protein
MPDDVVVAETSCKDYESFLSLPSGIMCEGEFLGKSAWNSDTQVAYYRSDKIIATDGCVGCYNPCLHFRDEKSREEYAISHLCQKCQDEIFTDSGIDDFDEEENFE